MHTEHLHNVRVGYVGLGWFVAVAVTSLVLFVLVALGVLEPDAEGSGRWITLAVAIGFLGGGVFVGFMTALAPILHGILIGLTSLVVWALLNAIVTLFLPDFKWTQLDATLAVNVLLVQIISAVVGTRFGYRFAGTNQIVRGE
jgi:hypothetical protein